VAFRTKRASSPAGGLPPLTNRAFTAKDVPPQKPPGASKERRAKRAGLKQKPGTRGQTCTAFFNGGRGGPATESTGPVSNPLVPTAGPGGAVLVRARVPCENRRRHVDLDPFAGAEPAPRGNKLSLGQRRMVGAREYALGPQRFTPLSPNRFPAAWDARGRASGGSGDWRNLDPGIVIGASDHADGPRGPGGLPHQATRPRPRARPRKRQTVPPWRAWTLALPFEAFGTVMRFGAVGHARCAPSAGSTLLFLISGPAGASGLDVDFPRVAGRPLTPRRGLGGTTPLFRPRASCTAKARPCP